MDYSYDEKKIVAVVKSDLEPGLAANVIGHLSVSLGKYSDEDIMGRPVLMDGSEVAHVGISRYPFITTKAKAAKIRKAIEMAKAEKKVFVIDYPEQMFSTGHDDELLKALQEVQEADIVYWGAIFYGKREDVDIYTKKFSLY